MNFLRTCTVHPFALRKLGRLHVVNELTTLLIGVYADFFGQTPHVRLADSLMGRMAVCIVLILAPKRLCNGYDCRNMVCSFAYLDCTFSHPHDFVGCFSVLGADRDYALQDTDSNLVV